MHCTFVTVLNCQGHFLCIVSADAWTTLYHIEAHATTYLYMICNSMLCIEHAMNKRKCESMDCLECMYKHEVIHRHTQQTLYTCTLVKSAHAVTVKQQVVEE